MKSVLTKNQKKKVGPRFFTEHGEQKRITAVLRYDDECGNGHNSFSITADIQRKGGNGQWYFDAGGCCHEEIEKRFPELAHLIKWHLFDSTGPMHYVANTMYHAGNRDCHGLLKGEVRAYAETVKFKGFPITFELTRSREFIQWLKQILAEGKRAGDFEIIAVEHKLEPGGYKYGPKFTFSGFPVKEWHLCPFDDEQEAQQWKEALLTLPFEIIETPCAWGEGKERELDAARHSAVWPEATDEDLTAPGLKERLEARLPELVERFKADMEAQGFTF